MSLSEDRLTPVFEMLVERLGALEAAEQRRASRERLEAEWAPKGTLVPASLYGGPEVMMLKTQAGQALPQPPDPLYVCLMGTSHTGHGYGNKCVYYTTEEWARGRRGGWDAELEEEWGDARLEEVRARVKAWKADAAASDGDEALDGDAPCDEVGLPAQHHEYASDEMFETVLRRRVAAAAATQGGAACRLVSWSVAGCVIEVSEGSVLAACALVLGEAKRALEDGRQAADVLPRAAEVRFTEWPALVSCCLGAHRVNAREAWDALSAGTKRRVARAARDGERERATGACGVAAEDCPVLGADHLQAMGIDWRAHV